MTEEKLSNYPTEEIVEKVNRLGANKVAQELGIPQSSFNRWIRRQGYVLKRQYVKEVKTTNQFQTA